MMAPQSDAGLDRRGGPGPVSSIRSRRPRTTSSNATRHRLRGTCSTSPGISRPPVGSRPKSNQRCSAAGGLLPLRLREPGEAPSAQRLACPPPAARRDPVTTPPRSTGRGRRGRCRAVTRETLLHVPGWCCVARLDPWRPGRSARSSPQRAARPSPAARGAARGRRQA